jgi:hypothetical protein
MSRVEDDRDAALAAARLAEQKRVEADQRTKKTTENAKFARMVGEQKAKGQVAQERSLAKSAIAELLQSVEADQAEAARAGQQLEHGEHLEKSNRAVRGEASVGEQAHGTARDESARSLGRHAVGDHESAQAGAGHEAENAVSNRGADSRRTDARAGKERLEQRKADSEASAQGRSPVGRGGPKGELKTDTDGGGGQGQQGGNSGKDPSKDGGGMGGNLRFNPALMAPVPVAQQKAASGSERLRKVANELAQKIVERVRVGTNALGRAEFQIDFRQDVLAGLSVKVSAHNGKISAVFSGSDKEILKLVEQQTEALKSALAGRGLKLEDVKIEART